MINVHYDLNTGRIVAMDSSHVVVAEPGCGVIQAPRMPDHRSEKVDVVTLALVSSDLKDEITDLDVRVEVYTELRITDEFMVPDRPVPARDDWVTYRQALRDLSKRDLSPADQVRAWPQRPNGADPIPHLRARL